MGDPVAVVEDEGKQIGRYPSDGVGGVAALLAVRTPSNSLCAASDPSRREIAARLVRMFFNSEMYALEGVTMMTCKNRHTVRSDAQLRSAKQAQGLFNFSGALATGALRRPLGRGLCVGPPLLRGE